MEIFTPESEIENNPNIGPKAKSLFFLKQRKYNIPGFKIIDGKRLSYALENEPEFINEVEKYFGDKRVIIRSSAASEDSATSSRAGQFSSKISETRANSFEVLKSVIDDFRLKESDLENFSIIIQEYIETKVAGVTFTRNPNGDRSLVLEYLETDISSDLVSGRRNPKRIEAIQQKYMADINGVDTKELFDTFRKIEKDFNFPQDIEWLISKENQFFIVQSRPITTIDKNKYEEIKLLEESLPRDSDYHFSKTALSESVPRPVNLMQFILKEIYSDTGPVASVYRKYRIKYKQTDFIKIIGNELYVDTKLEREGLFQDFSPKSFFNYLNNWIFIKRVDSKKNTIKILRDGITKSLKEESFDSSASEYFYNYFLKKYELIFEINLLTGVATSKLANLAKLSKIGLSDFYSESFINKNDLELLPEKYAEWIGNGLDISDKLKFTVSSSNNPPDFKNLAKNFNKVSRPLAEIYLEKTYELLKLREIGRWFTVRMINDLRNYIDSDLKYFCNDFSEFETVDSFELEERKNHFDSFNKFNLPSILSSKVENRMSEILVISKGTKVKGRLVSLETIGNEKSQILIVKTLTPDLVQYFPKISGILSENGGYLSHLGIMARENKVPVISGVDLGMVGIKVEDNVEVDFESGQILD